MYVNKLQKVFREIKKELNLDFSLTNVDNLGDCSSCVGYAIGEKYGVEAHGIWVKHWNKGMNRSRNIASQRALYIGHSLTPEQGEKVVEMLSRYYVLERPDFNQGICINIAEIEEATI